ncbi:MAG TPA: S8 family peptidase [Petrimonas sp.]|nr:S8 family peptidase [Petrimonas sp.]
MDKPILFLNDAAQSESFTTTKSGGGELRLPYRDRSAHAASLASKFNTARSTWGEQQQQRKALSLPSRDGCYLEILGKAGYELITNSLEDRRSKKTLGARLISVVTGDNQEKRAIVYIPYRQENKFLKKIQDYADSTKDKENKPQNKKQIESIEDIKLALLEDLWQDPKDSLPQEIPVWCELWLRTENIDADEVITKTQKICTAIGIETNKERLDFPERSVIAIRANREQLQELYAQSDNLAELRLAKEPVSFWSSMSNFEQTEAVDDLLDRVIADDKGVSVCILDSGINNGHRLLELFCSDHEKETYHPEWNPNDQEGHGTQMAGIAAFGDLQEALESRDSVTINHRLFSGKILPPPNFPENDPKLYGYITAQTISNCEIKGQVRKQLYCLAVTTLHDIEREGRPTSWSSEIDKLAFGEEDGFQRLILISAGNAKNLVDLQDLKKYPEINKELPVQNPAQAWNALTIGAYTEKVRITDPDYRDYNPLAQHGELSPHSTTSLTWDTKRWPNKPDIVLEGGNLLKTPDGTVDGCDDLCVLTTSHRPFGKQFELFDATSAATAQAAWMAAQIQSIVPNAWPETIRALMVHSAEWTPQLIAQFGIDLKKKGDIGNLLRIAGYGVPDLKKASECATNHLTLIAQEYIQPFKKEKGLVKTNIMHFYELPWPEEILRQIGDQSVTLKITLSYFIEPSPGELQTQNRYTYASHALRFDINSSQEKDNIEEFKKRINKQSWEDENDRSETKGFREEWKIGTTYRNKGTVQSDSITLSGIEIADCNHIAVYPIGGWWKTRTSEKCWEKQARYSLVVSLHTESEEIDIYTPVALKVMVEI